MENKYGHVVERKYDPHEVWCSARRIHITFHGEQAWSTLSFMESRDGTHYVWWRAGMVHITFHGEQGWYTLHLVESRDGTHCLVESRDGTYYVWLEKTWTSVVPNTRAWEQQEFNLIKCF